MIRKNIDQAVHCGRWIRKAIWAACCYTLTAVIPSIYCLCAILKDSHGSVKVVAKDWAAFALRKFPNNSVTPRTTALTEDPNNSGLHRAYGHWGQDPRPHATTCSFKFDEYLFFYSLLLSMRLYNQIMHFPNLFCVNKKTIIIFSMLNELTKLIKPVSLSC